MIDIRDLIDEFEGLEAQTEDGEVKLAEDDAVRHATLAALLDELAGNGGDHKWEGKWYPITLIPDAGFEDYARKLAEDCGMINNDAKWPANCIDWEEAARQLQQDYTTVEYDGVTYWYR